MQCLRCNAEMKHYDLNPNSTPTIYSSWYKPSPFSPEINQEHRIHSVYICENCGYVEFSTTICESSDI